MIPLRQIVYYYCELQWAFTQESTVGIIYSLIMTAYYDCVFDKETAHDICSLQHG